MATDDLAAKDRAALITEAGFLNNHWALVNVDHVSCMGWLDDDECRKHVAYLRRRVAEANLAAA